MNTNYDDEFISISDAIEKFKNVTTRMDFWIMFYTGLIEPEYFLRVGERIFVSKNLTEQQVVEAVTKLENLKYSSTYPSLDSCVALDEASKVIPLTRTRLYQMYHEHKYPSYFIRVGGKIFVNRDKLLSVYKGQTLADLVADDSETLPTTDNKE